MSVLHAGVQYLTFVTTDFFSILTISDSRLMILTNDTLCG